MPSSAPIPSWLDALPAIEAVVRRHLPARGYYLVDLAIKPSREGDDNPAPWEVIAYIGKTGEDGGSSGWGRDLATEIRRGWDGADFRFRIQMLSMRST